ncbi:MAG: hypothetical protein ACKVJL_04990 [Dehalococcoidia bacterium]
MANSSDVYGSGLNDQDWNSLRDVIWPFLHADDPSVIDVPSVPRHLVDHSVLKLIRDYRTTGDDQLLDKAGRYLIPTDEPFGWYIPLTK